MRVRMMALIGGALVVGALTLASFSTALAQGPGGPGRWGAGAGPGNGPAFENGRGPMGGPGMAGYGPMMGGPGMGQWRAPGGPGSGPGNGPGPGPGNGYGPSAGAANGYGPENCPAGGAYGPGGPWRGQATAGTPLTSLEAAQQAFQTYLQGLGNADLVLDEVMEFERNFYALVKEQSTGAGAFELLANKQTGVVFPEPGPNMMWNTKYGHAAAPGMMRGWQAQAPTGGTTIGPDQAQQIAQQWLDGNLPGTLAETPDAMPGYYTVHFERDGEVAGMLSVNGSSGQVWYHAWHGAFVAD